VSPVPIVPVAPAVPEPHKIDDHSGLGLSPKLGGTDRHGACSPHEVLVAAILERSPADMAWLAWSDSADPIVMGRQATFPLQPWAIGEFPEPPHSPEVVDGEARSEAWSLWCQAQGILSCMIVPVFDCGKIVGTVGLASCTADALREDDLHQLQLIASLAVHARRYEARLTGLRRLFDEVSRTLENALGLERALQLPPTYREIARSVGESLDVTYCRIGIRDAKGALTIRAVGGHRPPRKPVAVAWPLLQLTRCAEALRERHGVVLRFSEYDPVTELERTALFSPTTQTGVILPFFAGPRTQGVLIVGEERRSRGQPMSPERVALLEIVASRIGHIVRMARRLEYERLAERRRDRQITRERQKLAREVHDQVGQSLSGLLVQIRCAITQGQAGPDDLRVMENAARTAVDGARALAYGFRNLERGVRPLENARSYAETVLLAAHCTLAWSEERTDVRVTNKALREIARVVKESVNNIVRHANATAVRIRIQYPDGVIRATIHDDGVGFSPREVRQDRHGRGLGLVGNAERLARIGGTFDVQSSPKGGTLVMLEAPRL
jgi:signal transduction histidine kinase